MTDHRDAKDALYDGFAVVARALGSGRRAEIVDVLAQGERSVEEVALEIGQSVANTSQHLRHLARSGLARSRRDGNRVVYSVAGPRVAELWMALRDVAVDHVAEVRGLAEAYLGDRTELEQITRDELATRLRAGDVVVLDVRPEAEFRAGHIRGARSIPLAELRQRLHEVPRDVGVVAYCRGPYCAYADEAVHLMNRQGIRAARLEDGLPEWKRAGLAVDPV
ncbi:ArsR/SmtB family transcription factor [Rhodococcus sp. NPDC058514]|uniref:ArsR/SmtB family transcription factor n=1 Tax=unclassified Rhodococcus (in: high G+C Gram-positive bacteria) TaxID=192944 RepID=UPI0036473068